MPADRGTVMRTARRTLASRSRAERVAIIALRVAHCTDPAPSPSWADWTAQDLQPFAALALACDALDLKILDPGARFVSEDEMRITGWIAHRQRNAHLPASTEAGFDIAATTCAVTLSAKAILLPYQRAVTAFLDIGDTDRPPHSITAYPRNTRAAQRSRIRDRVIALVERQKLVATADFRKAGISRQNISRLCATGVIVRVSHGLYADRASLGGDASCREICPGGKK